MYDSGTGVQRTLHQVRAGCAPRYPHQHMTPLGGQMTTGEILHWKCWIDDSCERGAISERECACGCKLMHIMMWVYWVQKNGTIKRKKLSHWLSVMQSHRSSDGSHRTPIPVESQTHSMIGSWPTEQKIKKVGKTWMTCFGSIRLDNKSTHTSSVSLQCTGPLQPRYQVVRVCTIQLTIKRWAP